MSNRETAPTVHGEVSYETVECSSCGEMVAKEHATPFFIGDVNGTHKWTHKSEYEVELDLYDYEEGYACDYCKDDPIRFPCGRVFDTLGSLRAAAVVSLFVVGVYLL